MNISLFRKISTELSENGIDDADFEAKVLISHYCGCTISEAFFINEDKICSDVLIKIQTAVSKRINGEPIQYIIGEWDFMGHTFKVGEGVLIPRPETELLCEFAINEISHIENPIVYDLCSGSGCIGLSIKKAVEQSDVYLVEKSEDALKYLFENAHNLCGNTCLTIADGDIFHTESFKNFPKADIIVSNPPYIASAEITSLQKEVQCEPSIALDGGEDGLDFYRLLTTKWTSFLKDDGIMAFECGEDQAGSISELFDKNIFDITVMEDYNHIKRFVIGRRKK